MKGQATKTKDLWVEISPMVANLAQRISVENSLRPGTVWTRALARELGLSEYYDWDMPVRPRGAPEGDARQWARRLGVTPRTVTNMCQSGELSARQDKNGRWVIPDQEEPDVRGKGRPKKL